MLIVFALKQYINLFGTIKNKKDSYILIFDIEEKCIENEELQKIKEDK